MKKRSLFFVVLVSVLLMFNACGKHDIDDIKPEIKLSGEATFPLNCDTIYFGEEFTFTALFTDNVELGSYSIEVHQNFDHHAHSTQVNDCDLSPVKVPVNPFHFIQDFAITDNSQSYNAVQVINIPYSNQTGQFDEGDYHFFISLTDKEGWSAQMGLSIKMMYRQLNQ